MKKISIILVLITLSFTLYACINTETNTDTSKPFSGNESVVSAPNSETESVESDDVSIEAGDFSLTIKDEVKSSDTKINVFIMHQGEQGFEYDYSYTLEKKNDNGTWNKIEFGEDYFLQSVQAKVDKIDGAETREGPFTIKASDFGISNFEKGEYKISKEMYSVIISYEFIIND